MPREAGGLGTEDRWDLGEILAFGCITIIINIF